MREASVKKTPTLKKGSSRSWQGWGNVPKMEETRGRLGKKKNQKNEKAKTVRGKRLEAFWKAPGRP